MSVILPASNGSAEMRALIANCTAFERYMVRHNMFVLFIKTALESYSSIPNSNTSLKVTNISAVLEEQLLSEQNMMFGGAFKNTLISLGIIPHTQQLKTFIFDILVPMSEICTTLSVLKKLATPEIDMNNITHMELLLKLYKLLYSIPTYDMQKTYDSITFVVESSVTLRNAFLYVLEALLTYTYPNQAMGKTSNHQKIQTPEEITDINKRYLKSHYLMMNASQLWNMLMTKFPESISPSKGLNVFFSLMLNQEIADKLTGSTDSENTKKIQEAISKLCRKYSTIAVQMMSDIVNVYRIPIPRERNLDLFFLQVVQTEREKQNETLKIVDYLIESTNAMFEVADSVFESVPNGLKEKLLHEIKVYCQNSKKGL